MGGGCTVVMGKERWCGKSGKIGWWTVFSISNGRMLTDDAMDGVERMSMSARRERSNVQKKKQMPTSPYSLGCALTTHTDRTPKCLQFQIPLRKGEKLVPKGHSLQKATCVNRGTMPELGIWGQSLGEKVRGYGKSWGGGSVPYGSSFGGLWHEKDFGGDGEVKP